MANYSLAVRMYPEPLRSLAFSSLSGTYMGIGTPLVNPSLQLIIQNWTDVAVLISFDGVNDHLALFSGSAWDSDNTANKGRESGLYMPIGQRFYVKQYDGTAATVGAILVTSFYGQGT